MKQSAKINILDSSSGQQEMAAYIVSNQKSRIKDAWGSGQFGAQRDRGERIHNGLDIVVNEGDEIYAPFDGNVVKEAVPYGTDNSYKGIVIHGTGSWTGYEVKIFYAIGLMSGTVSKTQTIGNAQNISLKYPGITNHVHVEVKKDNVRIDPFEIWQMSF